MAGLLCERRQTGTGHQVKAVYYRNDPIILGAWPGRPPHDSTYRHSIIKSANLWELLDARGSAVSRGSTGRNRAGKSLDACES